MPSNLEVHRVPVAASHATDDDVDDEVEEEFTVRSPMEQAWKALEPGSEFEGIIRCVFGLFEGCKSQRI
jgi:hypothetical protein